MGAFLGAIGMIVGVIGGLGWLIYSLIKQRPKKNPLILIVIGVVLFVVGISITPSTNKSENTTTTHISKTQAVLAHLKDNYREDYKDNVKVTYNANTKAFVLKVTDTNILKDLKNKMNDSGSPTPDLDRFLNKMKASSKYIDSKLGDNKYSLQFKDSNDNTKTYYSAYSGNLNDLINKK